jgi:hypothetical protein
LIFFFFQKKKFSKMFSLFRRSLAATATAGGKSEALKGDIVSAALQNVSNLDPVAVAAAARRREGVSKQIGLPISAIKLRWLANQVRGLPYTAAVAQMQLSARRKG